MTALVGRDVERTFSAVCGDFDWTSAPTARMRPAARISAISTICACDWLQVGVHFRCSSHEGKLNQKSQMSRCSTKIQK